ncbi:hypothetical protein [Bacillus massiliigorillae]|uniref:hypothetical protein n=1 Tax=Bacillus massiliigorillae TaxID=1243664 RepID=UPI00039B4910|nr:hypothetical protein [Bacillus massiliigorillae]
MSTRKKNKINKDYNKAKNLAELITQLTLAGKHDEVEQIIQEHNATKNGEALISKQSTSLNSIEEQIHIDFSNADKFQYERTPNTDSIRFRNEQLGGSGSNMYGGRKKK